MDSNINLRSKEDPISSVSQVLEGNFLHQGDNQQGSSNNLRCLSKWRIPIWALEGHHLLVDILYTSVLTHLSRPDLRILLQSQLNNSLYNEKNCFLNFGNNEPARCLKITEKVSFNIASEASYVYILRGQKFIKNAKNGPIWRVFENLKLAVKQNYQTGQS